MVAHNCLTEAPRKATSIVLAVTLAGALTPTHRLIAYADEPAAGEAQAAVEPAQKTEQAPAQEAGKAQPQETGQAQAQAQAQEAGQTSESNDDAKLKEEASVRKSCEDLIESTEKKLKELGDKTSAEIKQDAEEAVAKAKAALEGQDIEAVKTAAEKLREIDGKLADLLADNASKGVGSEASSAKELTGQEGGEGSSRAAAEVDAGERGDSEKAGSKSVLQLSAQAKSGKLVDGAVTWSYKGSIITGVKASGSIEELVVPASLTVNGETIQLTSVKINLGNISVKKLIISDGVNLDNSCAGDCRTLETVVVGNNVTFGRTSPLSNAINLTSAVLGTGVTGISIFEGCKNLKTITTSSMVGNMLMGCPEAEIVFTDDVDFSNLGASLFRYSANLTSYDFAGKGVRTIGSNCFSDSALEGEIELPSSVESVGSSAFSNTNITSAKLDCASLGHWAFSNCYDLESVTIGPNVQTIAPTTFGKIGLGVKFTVDSGNANFKVTEDGRLTNADGTVTYYPYVDPNAKPVTVFSDSQMSNRAYYRKGKLAIPSTVTSISASFETDSPIDEIVLESGNTAFVVDEQGVLYNADKTILYKAPSGITSITVPDTVKEIRENAFRGCASLESITLPEGVKAIPARAFKGCTSLQVVALPKDLEVIDYLAFSGCEKLSTITLPSTVQHIGSGAFEGTAIDSLAVSESLWVTKKPSDFVEDPEGTTNCLFFGWNTNVSTLFEHAASAFSSLDLSAYSADFLPHYAFAGLSGLTEVAIPSIVRSLGSGTFYECRNLNTVYCYSPDSLVVKTGSTGHGNSGSGDATESYEVSNAGTFSLWNPDRESSGAGSASKFEDRTGITFYGSAYNKDLITYCDNCGQNFVPIVTLQTLAGTANPLWNKTLDKSFAIDYGEGAADYDCVQIANIDKGGTPQVLAKFGQYDGTRDLTNDSACTIVYYGPDGNKVTSFDEDGVYTASLVGDNKSVFGARMIKFNVGTVQEPASEDPSSEKPANDEPGAEKPGNEKPATDEPGAEKPGDSKDNGNASEAPSANGGRAATTIYAPSAAQGGGTVYQPAYVSASAARVAQVGGAGAASAYDASSGDLPKVLEGIAGTDNTVLIWGGSNSASPQYVWEVSGGKLTADNIAKLDFAVDDASKDAGIAQLVGNADFVAFTVKQDGPFPAAYKLHWKTSSTFYDGAKVDVYRVVPSSATTRGTSGVPFVEKAYAADGDEALELVKSGVVATDGYVTVDVDSGGTYVLVESSASSGLPFVETAYADTGEVAAVDVDANAQQASNWMMPAAIAAAIAAVAAACGGVFARGRRRDGGTEHTSEQKR